MSAPPYNKNINNLVYPPQTLLSVIPDTKYTLTSTPSSTKRISSNLSGKQRIHNGAAWPLVRIFVDKYKSETHFQDSLQPIHQQIYRDTPYKTQFVVVNSINQIEYAIRKCLVLQYLRLHQTIVKLSVGVFLVNVQEFLVMPL